jgi:hypothetical protein
VGKKGNKSQGVNSLSEPLNSYELMGGHDTPENDRDEVLSGTSISDLWLRLLGSQYPECLQVAILMVTLVVLTKTFKKTAH